MVQAGQAADEPSDLKQLFFALLHYWKTIVLCMLLALVLAVLYLRGSKPVYDVNAVLQIKDEGKSLSTALLGSSVSSLIEGKSAADTEVQLIKSRAVIGKAIDNLNLDIGLSARDDRFFKRILQPNTYNTTYTASKVGIYNKTGAGFDLEQLELPVAYRDLPVMLTFLDQQRYRLTLPDEESITGVVNQRNHQLGNGQPLTLLITHANRVAGQQFVLTQYHLQTAVNRVNRQLSAAEAGKQTGIINVNYQSSDKVLATNTLNEVLRVYIQQNLNDKMAETQSTLYFVDKQLPQLKQQLEAAEERFNRFREQNGTIDVNQEAELLLKQNVELETRRIELQQKRAELTARYTADYPLVKEVDQQLASIAQKSGEYTKRVGQLPEVQRHYLQLYRDMQINTELYTNLLNSYQQLKIAKASQIGNARIVDRAITPIKPVKPKPLLVLVIATLGGLFFGVLVALLRNLFNIGIKDSSRIEELTGLPVYATVPHSKIMERAQRIVSKSNMLPLLALQDNEDLSVESLRSIRTVLHFAQSTAKNNIVMITGPAPGIGKSFVSSNLAAIMAQSGQRVVVIDGDMRRGHMQLYFKQPNQQGLADYLNFQLDDIATLVKPTEVAGLSFICRGKNPSNPSELLMSQRFTQLLQMLSQQFDQVIIDTPPVLAVTDGVTIGQHVGTIIMVTRYNVTHEREMMMAINRLEQAGQRVNGVVLNGVQKYAGDAYGYNYHYGYTSKD